MRIYQCFSEITPSAVRDLVSQYDSLLPDNLRDLDRQRYVDIPAAVARRCDHPKAVKKDQNDASEDLVDPPFITKDELVTLVKWKLKHGTFRPRLLSLASSNSEDAIRKASSKAFKAIVPNQRLADAPRLQSLHNAVEILKKLNGIGPATASLILSVYDPRDIPFFSDPLFKWACTNIDTFAWFDEGMKVKADRALPAFNYKWNIKYVRQEYHKLNAQVAEWRSGEIGAGWRSDEVAEDGCKDISCVDLEKAAWVLARLDGISEERLGMAGEQEAGLKRKSTSELEEHDTSKMKRFQGRPNQKDKSALPKKQRDAKKHESEAYDTDHPKKRLRSNKTTGKVAKSVQ